MCVQCVVSVSERVRKVSSYVGKENKGGKATIAAESSLRFFYFNFITNLIKKPFH